MDEEAFSEQISKTVVVKYFFPERGLQNPFGIEPNWFYYWTQITGSGDLSYGGPHPTRFGLYDYRGNEGHLDKCIIYDRVVDRNNPTGPQGKAGIDCFGQTISHERKHRSQFHEGFTDTTGDGVPDYDASKDTDGDWLSDSYEDAHGFDKFSRDTNGNGIEDREEEPLQAEFNWPNESHKLEDWACPGQQWPDCP